MGAEGHVLLPASGHDMRVTELDVLSRQRHGAQARAADLIDAPSRALLRQPCVDMRLTCRVLTLGGGQHLPQNGLRDFGRVHPGAGHQFFQNGGTKVMGGRIGERSAETAHGGPGGGCDDDIGHDVTFLYLVGRGHTDTRHRRAWALPSL